MLTDYTALAVMSFMVFIAVIAVLAKFSPTMLRRILGYELVADISAFAAMKALMFGTATGMLIAFGGGLMFSIVLMVAKAFMGYEKLERVPCCHCGAKPLRWVRHPGKLGLSSLRSSRSVTA